MVYCARCNAYHYPSSSCPDAFPLDTEITPWITWTTTTTTKDENSQLITALYALTTAINLATTALLALKQQLDDFDDDFDEDSPDLN